MTGRYANGDPDETYGSVAVADVVRAIRDLEPGFHTVDEVRNRYVALTGARLGPELHYVAGTVTRLGLKRCIKDYESGWFIDPARLARRWPRLPWRD